MLPNALFLYPDIRPLSSKVKQEFTPTPLNSGTSNRQWLSVSQHVAPSSCFVKVMKASHCISSSSNVFLNFCQLVSSANFEVKKLPKLSKKDIEHVEEATRQQAANPLWHESRIGRITASSFHEINVKVKKLANTKEVNFSNTLNKIFGCGPNLSDLPAIKYGVAMELEAKIKY